MKKNLIKLMMTFVFSLVLVSCSGEQQDQSNAVADLSLSTSDNSLVVGSSTVYARITAKVVDQNQQPVTGALIAFETNLGSLNAREVRTDNQGEASVQFYPGDQVGEAVITAFVNGYQQSINITVTSTQTTSIVTGLSLLAMNSEIPADGQTIVKLVATAQDSNGLGVAFRNVTFHTNNGILLRDRQGSQSGATLTQATDSAGQAVVYLRSDTRASMAQVSASVDGVNAFTNIQFIAGSVDTEKSQIVLMPSTIPSDGQSTSTVDVLLLDAYGNAVVDGTLVSLETSLGQVIGDNPTRTSLGHATFSVQAAQQAGNALIKVREYPDLSTTLVMGAPTTGLPFRITVTPESKSLFVKGVGKKDSISVAIEIRDSAGNLIQDAQPGVNNLKVSFVTRPESGEELVGTDASGNPVSSDSSIFVRTTQGAASISLKSGTRPGVVELRIEALDNEGNDLSPPVTANVSEIGIASGPPHNIAISYPSVDRVSNLGGGVYQRVGSLSVTDQYGNAVPDGTVVNLGYLDRVIVSNTNTVPAINAPANTNATFTENSSVLTDASVNFGGATITSNLTSREILQNDRVLVLNAQANDKARFVERVGSSTITVNKDFNHSQSHLNYLVGSALLGGQVLGVNAQTGEERTGVATTQNGVATFKITYPADNQHILTGCYSDLRIDTRVTPYGSAQTWLVAESNETGAANVDHRGCFAAAEPFVLTNQSGSSTLSSSGTIHYLLEDANAIQLPFVLLSTSVSYTVNQGNLQVSVGQCEERGGIGDRRTNESGVCSLPINISGGVSGDSATVMISAPGHASANTITVSIP